MKNYTNVNINIKELEKDYWEWILKEYTKTYNNTKFKYISNNYKTFMKTIKWIESYKMDIAKAVWKYGAFLLPLMDAVNEDNSIDMKLFQERNKISDWQINRIIASYKDNMVLKKVWYIFYLNPLIAFSWKDIRLDLGVLFKEELKKVWITIK